MAPNNSKLVVKHRVLNENEHRQQQMRLSQLEPPAEESDEDDDDEDEEQEDDDEAEADEGGIQQRDGDDKEANDATQHKGDERPDKVNNILLAVTECSAGYVVLLFIQASYVETLLLRRTYFRVSLNNENK